MKTSPRRRPPIRTCVWLWLVAFAFLLQGAVPLFATAAAKRQGVALAELCSVYGVRTVSADAAAADQDQTPAPDRHAAKAHCPLGSLMGSLALAAPVAAVVLHAPQQPRLRPFHAPRPLPADASRLWLAGRLHAPPVPV